jgi:hypothetical protein
MTNQITVNSWEELQTQLFHDSWDDSIKRYRSNYVYRGLWNSHHGLTTSLARLEGPYAALEPHMLRNFRKYAHSTASPGSSVWNWLAVAQHHGLPTRLLDWTYSPYVALHFATLHMQHEVDSTIWAVNYVKATQYLPHRLKEVLTDIGANVFTPEILEQVCTSLPELETLQKEDYLVFLEPPSLDARIVHQFALFSLMSRAEAQMSTWLEAHPELYFRIIIPAHLKWEIRDKLDQANITERVLFPGLNGLSEWLRRHYSSNNSVREPR